MGYRKVEKWRQLRLLRADKIRRRRYWSWIWGISAMAYLVLGLGFLSRGGGVGDDFKAPAGSLALTFEKSRMPITRSTTAHLSLPVDGNRVVTVRLSGDPRSDANQFPANQIRIVGEIVSEGVVSLTVSTNPWTPERVPGGIYQGVVNLSSGAASSSVPLYIVIGNREGYWAIVAFFTIFIGAVLGLTVKWITERLTPQAAAHQRLVALQRSVGWGRDGRNLPATARLRFEELEDLIARQNYGSAEKVFSELDHRRSELAVVVSQIGLLYDRLDEQVREIDAYRKRLSPGQLGRVDAALDEEYRKLLEVQSIEWPGDGDSLNAELREIRPCFIASAQIISSFLCCLGDIVLRDAVVLLGRGDYEAAQNKYEERNRDPESHSIETEAVEAIGQHKRGRIRDWPVETTSMSMIFRLARPIAGLASLLLVAFVGLKTQYLDSQGFDGDVSAWVALGLWGLAIELSGVSVADVLARLAGSGGSSSLRPPAGP